MDDGGEVNKGQREFRISVPKLRRDQSPADVASPSPSTSRHLDRSGARSPEDPTRDSKEAENALRKVAENAVKQGIYRVSYDRGSGVLSVDQSVGGDKESLEVTVTPKLSREGNLSHLEIKGNKMDENQATTAEGKYLVSMDNNGQVERVFDGGVYGTGTDLTDPNKTRTYTYASEIPFDQIIGPAQIGADIVRARQALSQQATYKVLTEKGNRNFINLDGISELSKSLPTADEIQSRRPEIGGYDFRKYGAPSGKPEDVLAGLVANGRKDLAVTEREFFDRTSQVIKGSLPPASGGMAPRPLGPRVT